jgi:hypothetical protein
VQKPQTTGFQQAATAPLSQRSNPVSAQGSLSFFPWLIPIAVLVLVISRRRGAAERKRKANNQEAMAKLGETKDERSKNIDTAFDKKQATVHFKLNDNGIKCDPSRA